MLSADDTAKLRKKAGEYNDLWDKHLRSCAEFDNARKRWDRERSELVKFSNFMLIKDFVVILDELGHALDSIKKLQSQDAIAQGIELTYNNMFNLLKKEGVSCIEAVGKKFDPHMHEIIGQKESDDDREHIVLEEVQKGYLLADKVLRTSKVIIGIKRQKSEVGPDATAGIKSQETEYKEEIAEDINTEEEKQEENSSKNIEEGD